jgi:hypothetical protein
MPNLKAAYAIERAVATGQAVAVMAGNLYKNNFTLQLKDAMGFSEAGQVPLYVSKRHLSGNCDNAGSDSQSRTRNRL